MKLYILALFLILTTLPFVSASHPNIEYTWIIGAGFLEEFGPVIANASNTHEGDTIQLMGQGNLSTKPKTIDGEGTFIHRDPSGNIIGTGHWQAEKLISFKSYGPGTPQGLPENFEGGRAIVRVKLHPDAGGESEGSHTEEEFEGTLRIECAIGNHPPKSMEGIRLAIRELKLNFNREVSGATLFIRK